MLSVDGVRFRFNIEKDDCKACEVWKEEKQPSRLCALFYNSFHLQASPTLSRRSRHCSQWVITVSWQLHAFYNDLCVVVPT